MLRGGETMENIFFLSLMPPILVDSLVAIQWSDPELRCDVNLFFG